MQPIHVCILSCMHPPDDVRGTQKEAMSFRRAGFRVTWVGPERCRSGDDFGIDFRYYPMGQGRLGRLLNHRKAERLAATLDKVDVYFALEPDSALAAVRLARRTGSKAVFDIHEVYHEGMLDRWAGGFAKKILRYYLLHKLGRICRKSDLSIGVSETVLAPYRHLQVPMMILRNCAPISFADGAAAEILNPARQSISIMHGKAIGIETGTENILRAAALATQRLGRTVRVIMFEPAFQKENEYRLEELMRFARSVGAAECVDYRKPVSHGEMVGILRTLDIGMIMASRGYGQYLLPNRLFEYMSAGVPVIGPDYAVEIRRIIDAEQCGFSVNCENPQAVANAIVHLGQNPAEAQEMGRLAREAFLRRHNWQVEVQPLLDWIRTAATPSAMAADPRG